MYDKENEFVPLNIEELSKNDAVWEVIKEEINYLGGDCLMKIITAAKEAGLSDDQIFMPSYEKTEVEFADPFESSLPKSTTEELK